TRYFSNTQVMPLEVSQSQASVPSRSMASISNPPPGITTTAAPVFFPVGAYTVIVGRVTLVTAVTGLPASNLPLTVAVSVPGTGCRAGAAPGQIVICLFPAAGCQTVVAACALPHVASRHRAIVKNFMMLSMLAFAKVVRLMQGLACRNFPMLRAASGPLQSFSWISSGRRAAVDGE